jgi:sporulation protein YlmC with PRC-barrel domain
MLRKCLIAALSGAALVSAGPALAHPGNGGGNGGGHGNAGAAATAGGGGGAASGLGLGAGGGLGSGISNIPMGNPASTMGAGNAQVNSQGGLNASANGHANAGANSILAGTTSTTKITSGALSGLTSGTTLMSNGTTVGTVQQIRTNANGQVVMVLVQGTNGQTYAIPANKLTMVNGVLSTTSRLNGINGGTNAGSNSQGRLNSQGIYHASPTGIAHANYHSVLASGAVSSSTLPGLMTGTPILTSGGTTLGNVTQIVTGSDGLIRMVIVTNPTTGQTYRLIPNMLTTSGGTFTTSQFGG